MGHAWEQEVHAAAVAAPAGYTSQPTAFFPDDKGAELPAASCGTQQLRSGIYFQEEPGIISSLHLLLGE